MWNLKYGTNEFIYQTERLTNITELRLPKDTGSVGEKEWEFRGSRCKLLHTDWINNKVLLYSTENYTQYLVINHNGKEYVKENMYMHTYICCYVCIAESFCSTTVINTTL